MVKSLPGIQETCIQSLGGEDALERGMEAYSMGSHSVQLCLTLCNPMDGSTPGLPVQCQLQEAAQTHVHRVGDAIQPSHPLSVCSPPTFSLSQDQDLFQ